ncbi:MAG: hypothetical protein M3Y79_13315 [Pseudomonadota bacterium]|nr:hypothetical protein [Pseudomonadota bacterium]
MPANLFNTVPAHDHLGFWANQVLDAQKVATFLDLDKREVARIADVSPSSVRWDHKIPREVLDLMTQIAIICALVAQFFQGDVGKTSLWFRTKNPLLGNLSPRDMVRYGRHEKLRRIVMDALNENGIPTPETISVDIRGQGREAPKPKTRAS